MTAQLSFPLAFLAVSGGLIALVLLLLVGVGVGGYFWWQKRLEAREKAEWEAIPVKKLDEVAPPKKHLNMDFPDIEPDRNDSING